VLSRVATIVRARSRSLFQFTRFFDVQLQLSRERLKDPVIFGSLRCYRSKMVICISAGSRIKSATYRGETRLQELQSTNRDYMANKAAARQHLARNPDYSTRVQRSDHLFIHENVGKNNDVPHSRVKIASVN